MLTEQQDRSVAVADRALPAAERADLVALVADMLVTKGTALGALGRIYEGAGVIEIGLRLAERHGLAVTTLRARLNHGFLMGKVDPRATLESDRFGLAEARRLGQHRFELLFLTNAAADAVWTGDWDWALTELEELLTGELEREDRFLVLGRLAIVRAWRGGGADVLLDEMERLLGTAPDPNHARFIVEVRAIRAFALGQFADAGAAYRGLAQTEIGNARLYLMVAARAALLARDAAAVSADLEALEGLGVHGPWFDACRTSIRAGLAALNGRLGDAQALYRDALRRLREIGVALDEALTAIEMATLLDPAEPDVRAAAGAAREILVRLGATPFIARLDEALARSPESAGFAEAGVAIRDASVTTI